MDEISRNGCKLAPPLSPGKQAIASDFKYDGPGFGKAGVLPFALEGAIGKVTVERK